MPGRKKKGAPVHANKTAYVHLRHCKENRLPESPYNSMYGGMCTKCRKLMDWKKNYGKWRAMAQPGVCGACRERKVTHPFARICQQCVQQTKKCAHCQKTPEEEGDQLGAFALSHSEKQRSETQQEKEMGMLRERAKRRLLRELGADDSESESDQERTARKERKEEKSGKFMEQSSDVEDGSEEGGEWRATRRKNLGNVDQSPMMHRST